MIVHDFWHSFSFTFYHFLQSWEVIVSTDVSRDLGFIATA